MKRLYLRWSGLVVVAAVIGGMAMWRVCHEVAALTPEAVLSQAPPGEIRVAGRVVEVASDRGVPTFRFMDERVEPFRVRYTGPPDDNIRELKYLVVVGQWNPTERLFSADKIFPNPNIGFIVSAYLVACLSSALFLFGMEQKVARLYTLIKEEKIYQTG